MNSEIEVIGQVYNAIPTFTDYDFHDFGKIPFFSFFFFWLVKISLDESAPFQKRATFLNGSLIWYKSLGNSRTEKDQCITCFKQLKFHVLINKHDENFIYQTEDDLLEYQFNSNSIKNIPLCMLIFKLIYSVLMFVQCTSLIHIMK